MKRRYPLEPLRGLRREQADQRALEAAEQARRAEQAERTRLAAQRLRELEQRRVAEITRGERERLEAGAARAGDLHRSAIWADGASRRIADRCRAEQESEEQAVRSRELEKAARASLAGADGAAKALDKHREAWQRERVLAAERVLEDEAHDRAAARSMLAKNTRRGGR